MKLTNNSKSIELKFVNFVKKSTNVSSFIVIEKSNVKKKLKKKSSNDQNIDVFSKINYDEKTDFFETRSKNKKLTSKYIDFFIFHEHKNSNVFDYIRYNI